MAAAEGLVHVGKTFDDLDDKVLRLIVAPLDLKTRCRLMRTCKALKAAVETSKWTNLGNGKLIVSGLQTSIGLFVLFECGGVIEFDNLKSAHDGFSKLHATFGQLHLKELRLYDAPLEHCALRTLNDFLDKGITFDKLSIKKSEAGPLSDRTRELMSRAEKEVVIEMNEGALSSEEILSLDRPTTLVLHDEHGGPVHSLTINRFLRGTRMLELVRKGHSLIRFLTLPISAEELAEVIEAPQVYGPTRRNRQASTSFIHQDALIILDSRTIPIHCCLGSKRPARIVVTSKGYVGQ